MILNRIKIINSVNLETFTIKKKKKEHSFLMMDGKGEYMILNNNINYTHETLIKERRTYV